LFAFVGAGMVLYGTIVLIWMGKGSTKWLNLAMKQNGGQFTQAQVKDVRQVMRLCPYLSFMILFWAIYGQQSTNFMLQGCQMDLRLNTKSNNVLLSSSFLSILDSSVILIFIPIFDRIFYPFMINVCGIQLTLLRKIGMGFVCCFFSMIIAGWIEQKRKQTSLIIPEIYSNCGGSQPMNEMSIWWQTPQYLFIGISEILTSISCKYVCLL
jgi:dipeptide/tripeptide permease